MIQKHWQQQNNYSKATHMVIVIHQGTIKEGTTQILRQQHDNLSWKWQPKWVTRQFIKTQLA